MSFTIPNTQHPTPYLTCAFAGVSFVILLTDSPAPCDELHDDDGYGAEQQDMQKTSLMKNHADGPRDQQHDGDDPEHLILFSLFK